MRSKNSRLWIPILLLLLACRALAPVGFQAPAATPKSLPKAPVWLRLPVSSAPLSENDFRVHLHPDGDLYVGDRVSLEIFLEDESLLDTGRYTVQVQDDRGNRIGRGEFGRFGIGKRRQATLLWAWNTSQLEPGPHTLTFSISPNGPVWHQQVSLLPRSELPLQEANAAWATAENACCQVHYLTGTAAERDLNDILKMADEQTQALESLMGVTLDEPVSIVLMPRVLGHGGFTGKEISISYLDRNYAGSSPAIVLHHELVHLLDSRAPADLRPIFLVEGLAVYLTGGHFKPEPLLPRAAALLSPTPTCLQAGQQVDPGIAPLSGQSAEAACGLDRYIPLGQLADHFYQHQHEISYLESGSLVEYMVNTWGWEGFWDFYRDIHPQANGSQSAAVNQALIDHFDISLSALEQGFRNALESQPRTVEMVADVRLSMMYYDTVRRYQQILDPSAYFEFAWLPNQIQMRQDGIVADLLRRPSTPENIALENLLVAANDYLEAGDAVHARQSLQAVNAMLDVYARPDAGQVPFPHKSMQPGSSYTHIRMPDLSTIP
jgi:hypothetical protein